MTYFEGAERFDIKGGTFQDMKEQHNYTDDRGFRITGDGNTTTFSPDHSIKDNRVYDSRIMAAPAPIQPQSNPLVYMEGQPSAHMQAYSPPSTVANLQAEIQLLQLQLEKSRLQQQLAASAPLGSQFPSAPSTYQPQNISLQPAIPQQYAPGTHPGLYVQSLQPAPVQTSLPVQPPSIQTLGLTPMNALSISRPPSSSVASTGENIGPVVPVAQPPVVSQNVQIATNTTVDASMAPYYPPLSTAQMPQTVLVPVHVGGGAQEPVLKKNRRSWFTRVLQKLGLKKKKN